MEVNFKKQLMERQEHVYSLLKEMKEKEKEFQEYCRQVEIDRKLFMRFKVPSFNFFLFYRRSQYGGISIEL